MKSPTKIMFATRRTVWGMGITAAAMAVLCGSNALAQMAAPFSQGNLVVDRAGNGQAALGGATPIFLDQYTPGGTQVSSQMLPTNGASELTDAGSSTTEGFLSLNPYGTNLVLAGYNVPISPTTPSGVSPATTPRAVATVDFDGNFNIISNSYTAFATGNIRSATTDGGTNFWAAGSVTGINYMGTGPTNNTSVPANSANNRVIHVIGGNIYFSTGSGTRGIYEISGTPITTGNTAANVINTTPVGGSFFCYDFAFNPGMTTAYIADNDNYTTPSAAGGIEKWTLVSGTWTFQYSLAPGTGNGADGVAVDWTTTPATIYATTASGNALVKVQDNGAGTVAVTNALAPANTAFRSVSFAPTNATVIPLAPVITGISPSGSQTLPVSASVTYTLSGFTGSPIGSNFWYKVSNSVTYLMSNQTGTTLTLTNLALTDSASYYAVVSNATAAVASPTVSLTVTPAPFIASITPSLVATNPGSTVTFTLNGSPGNPVANYFWFYKTNGISTLITNTLFANEFPTISSLTLTNVAFTNGGSYFCILTNNFGSATSSVAILVVSNFPPAITGIAPLNATNSAGENAAFTVTNSGTGPFTYFWYKNAATTNLISITTTPTLSLTDVLAGNAGKYQVVVSNLTSINATSAVASLTVTGDPAILVEPASVQGLVDGTVQFAVTVAATAPTFQWYITDTNGDIIAPAVSLGDGSVISGANSSTLTVANLQPTDLTNFEVIVTGTFGSVTSSVASILGGPNYATLNGDYEEDYQGDPLPIAGGVLALWDFDGPQFTNTGVNPNSINDPAPILGSGTAFAVGLPNDPGTSPFAGATDPADVGFDPNEGAYAFTPYGFEQPSPNNSWGINNFPATNGVNKANGMQFNVSTVGARNIKINYDARVSATASEFHRLQYTTNGTTWIDYPASSSFDGLSGSGNAGYHPFSYNLTGFPGVDNNPNFGCRIVTEWQSTAAYGLGATNFWVGTANLYNSGASGNSAAGTFTVDVVAVLGDAITNNNVAPTIGFLVNNAATLPTTSYVSPTNSYTYYATNMVDTNFVTFAFTASSPQMPATNLTFTVAPLNQVSAGQFANPVSPNFTVANTGPTNFLLTIAFSPGEYIPDPIDASPILITATDTNGESATASFLLTVMSINQPPTNTLTALHDTNTLANTSLTIPFNVGSGRNPNTNLTVTVTSDNNTVIPVGNISIGGATNGGVVNNAGNFGVTNTTGNLTVTLTPAQEQVGNALISVTVSDNDPVEPRSTTAIMAVIVRPNANILAIDYFNYDNSGSLDTIASGYWQHLSGINGQLQAGNGVATISSGNTENLEAPLVGAPYRTNSGAVLYSSCTINVNVLPTASTYFLDFNDGTDVPANTGNVEDCLVVTTNGAAPGYYRLGIANRTAGTAQIFPVDLQPGLTNFVVTSLVLSNGNSTIWLNPTNAASASLTDTTSVTPLYNIGAYELRESGSSEGTVYVGNVLVGTAFSSVFYPPQANPEAVGVTENTTTLLNPLPIDGGSNLRITSVVPDANGTATAGGTSISFTPAANFVGTSTISYTVTDDVSNTSTATITVLVTNIPPLANPVTYTVPVNSVNNSLNPLTNDVVETPGGSLSLVSVSETDGHGTATASGNQVIFTPTASYTGGATISYTITDNVGGTSSSTISVNVGTVVAIPLGVQASGNNIVLSWSNTPFAFTLESATNVAGPYFAVPSATSPYTNLDTTNAAEFFRLVH
jgi:hypothetical protein